MPIYEFECRDCGHRFDHLQRLSDADPRDCPSCGKPQLHRMVSAPSFRLAGSGWYETDFKKAGDKKHNLAGDGGKAQPEPAAKAAATPAAAAPATGASGTSGGGD